MPQDNQVGMQGLMQFIQQLMSRQQNPFGMDWQLRGRPQGQPSLQDLLGGPQVGMGMGGPMGGPRPGGLMNLPMVGPQPSPQPIPSATPGMAELLPLLLGMPGRAWGGMIPDGTNAVVGERGPEVVSSAPGGANVTPLGALNSRIPVGQPFIPNFMSNPSTPAGAIQGAINRPRTPMAPRMQQRPMGGIGNNLGMLSRMMGGYGRTGSPNNLPPRAGAGYNTGINPPAAALRQLLSMYL